MTLTNPISPWFLGQEPSVALTGADVQAVLGAPTKVLIPGSLPEGLRPLAKSARKAVDALNNVLKQEYIEGLPRLSPGWYFGAHGIGWSWQPPGFSTSVVVPVALYNNNGYKILTEGESRELAERKSLTGSSAFASLVGGLSGAQQTASGADAGAAKPSLFKRYPKTTIGGSVLGLAGLGLLVAKLLGK